MPNVESARDSASPRLAAWRAAAEVGVMFARMGITAFGGPAAYIAMMRDETVERRKWLDEQHFLDLLGATNLIPGPNASEMSMHLGYVRAGWPGMLAGGIGFLFPAMAISLGLAWAYEAYGSTPAAGWLMYGIKPVIIPLILLALWKMSQKAVQDRLTATTGLVTLGLYFTGINFVGLLLGGGLAVMLIRNAAALRDSRHLPILLPLIGPGLAAAAGSSFSLGKLFLIFAKIGLLLYGSGYVLFAFLKADLVDGYGWLTEQQLIDAIAIGQMTPGPLSSSATFIGYVLGGLPGALIATAGLYLPAFIVVAVSNPLIPRIRDSAWASGFLDGVNVAALGLMAAVTCELAYAAFEDTFTVLVGAAAAVLLLRGNVSSAVLVMFGTGMGLLSALF
ncbi:MAG: chromate efflux transporter [Anaerolineae bacterium]|nr:chromate efflux transporter [Anaerolineae bacterium]